MNLRTLFAPARAVRPHHRHPPPAPGPLPPPALLLGAAAAGALMVNVLAAGEPAEADSQMESVSIAEQLGISAGSAPSGADAVAPLEQLAASRAERDAASRPPRRPPSPRRTRPSSTPARPWSPPARSSPGAEAAAEAAREEQARQAAEAEAAAEAAAAERRERPGPGAPPPPARTRTTRWRKLGGDANEFSCLENLWGKESGWNPNAQNPTSTAYGIPQFLDSTWAGTGIAKTSDGYRQIDAGLIYIENRYGSPCGAWGHSQSNGWY